MASNFPTTLDNFTNPTSTDKTDSPSHAGQHSDLNDAVEALQAKVGIDSSADTGSVDYKLTNASSSNPGHKHTLAHGATDVTASAAELNILDGVTATTAELNKVDGISGSLLQGGSQLYIVSDWTYITGNTSAQRGSSDSFGVTFASPPIVIASIAGFRNNASAPTLLSQLDSAPTYQVGECHLSTHDVSTTGFEFTLDVGIGANWTTSIHIGVAWIAIGTLA